MLDHLAKVESMRYPALACICLLAGCTAYDWDAWEGARINDVTASGPLQNYRVVAVDGVRAARDAHEYHAVVPFVLVEQGERMVTVESESGDRFRVAGSFDGGMTYRLAYDGEGQLAFVVDLNYPSR